LRRFVTLSLTVVRSALRGLRASAVTSSVAVFTIAIALLLAGGFALLVGNMAGVLNRFGEELQLIAYLEADLSPEDQLALARSVETVEGVEAVEFVSKARALEQFRKSIGGSALLDGLEENPLPASLVVSLLPSSRTPVGLEILVSALVGLPGVTELAHGQEWVERYARFTSLVRSGSLVLAVVLGLAALMIVANTIRLAIYAREDELEILTLVGASKLFVRVPFLLEGLLQGALGGAIALVVLFAAFGLVLPQLEYGLALILGSASPRFFTVNEAAALVLAGGGLGLFGSATALAGWRRAA
jgi:cell division transport system permease protein